MLKRLLLLLLLAAAPAGAQTAERHMIAAAHPLAAEAGLAMLRAGGTALDAAIAAQMVLTLVEPQSSGIGGGALLLHRDAASRAIAAWDGRETAPAAATPGLFLRDGRPMPFFDAVVGGRSVGVPGAVRMLEAAHRAHGRLPWAALFEPAIRLAEQGFAVSPRLAQSIAADAERLSRDPGARALFFAPDGAPLPAGHLLRNPDLAETLRAAARDSADALHRGPIAEAIAAAVRGHPMNPGGMTPADLAGYAPVRRDAVCARYRVWQVCGFPPPSSGGVAVGQILGLLEHFDIAPLDPNGADAAHLLAEAGRLAFADRNLFLADADHVRVPVNGLLDPRYLMLRAQLIDRDRAIAAPRAGNPPWRDAAPRLAPQPTQPEAGTSHLSIVDAEGNAVAMTTTIESAFGARVVVRGFLLNNQLTDFAFVPEADGRPVANRVEPGKRPRSSMSPTLVLDAEGRLVAVLGSPGGARIIHYVARATVALLDWGMAPQAAAALPHVGTIGTALDLEAGTPLAALAPALTARGHAVRLMPMPSGLQIIAVSPEGASPRLRGGADPRREGVVLGD
ncbi:MAG: gamma-glutamyltransferase [Acetobacteraceae bacterium]